MAKLIPFKAVRPRRDLAHLVVSRPVSTYPSAILKAKLKENPFTFIHIIHPEFFENDKNRTAPNSKARFLKVKAKFEEFCDKNVFIKEDNASLYIYRQTKNNHEYLGVISGSSIEEYQQNVIKKHEATLTSREEMFTNYLDIVGVNAEPVLLSHEKNESIDRLLIKITQTRPEYEFSTADTVKHELWVVQGQQMNELLSEYEKIPTTYIADGHHRSASSARLAERLNKKGGATDLHNYFLTYLISEDRLNILPFNRLCRSLNGETPDSLLEKLSIHFNVEPLKTRKEPEQIHCIHCYLNQKWYALTCKPEIIDTSEAVKQIDAEILTQYILTPLLGIKDLKTDKNIKFISGEYGSVAVEKECKKLGFEVGFALYPVLVEQLKRVADENAIMPPKSTYIEPKLRSGLTIYTIK